MSLELNNLSSAVACKGLASEPYFNVSDREAAVHAVFNFSPTKPVSYLGRLSTLNRSWQSNKGTFSVSGIAGVESMQSKSK